MGLIFLFALVLTLALWWWQTGMLPFWEAGSGGDAPIRSDRSRLPPPPETAARAPEPLPPIEYPMPKLDEKDQPKVPLPPVERSDGAVNEALAGGGFRMDQIARFLNMQDHVKRLVITVDNLPREIVPSQMSMVQRIPGQLDVLKQDDVITLNPLNEARYDAFVAFAEALDPRMLTSVYLHFYPLLDSTYKDLGMPKARFHDRVIVAIDDLLAAPSPAGPIELVQPRVLYRFADPALQKLSSGQKIMIRVGPDNAARLKRVLRKLRAELVGQSIN
ncbi:MAG: DUF3014 domain-containing protein [Lautropia sp.]